MIPRQWKVIQTVRERFTCRACGTITQPPAPFHPIARGRAGPELLAMILEAKFGQHLPLNQQNETYAREGMELDTSTLPGWVGGAIQGSACAARGMAREGHGRRKLFELADLGRAPLAAEAVRRIDAIFNHVRVA